MPGRQIPLPGQCCDPGVLEQNWPGLRPETLTTVLPRIMLDTSLQFQPQEALLNLAGKCLSVFRRRSSAGVPYPAGRQSAPLWVRQSVPTPATAFIPSFTFLFVFQVAFSLRASASLTPPGCSQTLRQVWTWQQHLIQYDTYMCIL